MKYREDKTTQAAAIFISHDGGNMNIMKLIKLLYLADRNALLRWGRPITYDTYFSMPNGPVLSLTYDRINESPAEATKSYWHKHISERAVDYTIGLIKKVPTSELSAAELSLLHEIYLEFGHLTQWDLRDYSHQHLPEWHDPNGSSRRIPIRDILLAEGLSEDDVVDIETALQSESAARQLLS